MKKIKLYSLQWCPDCNAAKRVLDSKGLEYEVIDLEQNEAAVEIVVANRGKRVAPTLEYNGKFMDGNHFRQDKFEKDLEELLA